MSLQVTVELSPEMIIVLDQLSAFYNKERWQIIEMALEYLAADAKLIIETIDAKREAP